MTQPNYSAAELFSWFFERGEKGCVVVAYKGHIDDSADGKRRERVIASALVGSKDEWATSMLNGDARFAFLLPSNIWDLYL